MNLNQSKFWSRSLGRRLPWYITIGCLLGMLVAVPSQAEDQWADTFYQYRIPIDVKVEEPGIQRVTVDPEQIIAAINTTEELKFDPTFFAYNHLKVVGEDGVMVDDAGFHLIPVGAELMTTTLTGEAQKVDIPTEKDAYYLVSFEAEGSQTAPYHFAPTNQYEQIFPIGSKDRTHAYLSSYTPRLLPRKHMTHEALLRSDGEPMTLVAKDVFVQGVKHISVKKVEIVFLADFQKVGQQRLWLYHQPLTGWHLTIPQLRRDETPTQTASTSLSGPAQRYDGSTRYAVGSDENCDVWFAETTVKLTPQTAVPQTKSQGIKVTCAGNESQSFQLVIQPKQKLILTDVTVSDLARGTGGQIDSDDVRVQAVEYVPIRKSSNVTPTKYLGPIGDPLVPVERTEISPAEGNQIYWVTVHVAPGTASGTYEGTLAIDFEGRAPITIPLDLTVYDFELPQTLTFKSSMGGAFFQTRYSPEDKIVTDYHGVTTKEQLEKLAQKYFDVMASYKFYPENTIGYGGEIEFKWSPPPEGYDVDAPDNHFRLYDWDFTKFDRRMKHYVDEMKGNTLTLDKTNPQICNIFSKLPGIYVAWGSREGEAEAVQITRDQFDHLFLDYYRTVAQHMKENGWLDFARIVVDEGMDVERILHYCKLMKSDPLTAEINLTACIQGFEYFVHKEDPASTSYAFNGLLSYMPQVDEVYNRWEPHHFTDYDIAVKRDRNWNYLVYTNRIYIDTPGINNRILGLELYRKKVTGVHVWETFWWEGTGFLYSDNPWNDPGTHWGNGALSYFYPPRREGLPDEPDFSIVPSLRLETFRESADDYEYAMILEKLMGQAETKGLDVSRAQAIMDQINRFFYNPVLWSQNDAWYLDLRDSMAAAIVDLKHKLDD